jgi:hypothetical protein
MTVMLWPNTEMVIGARKKPAQLIAPAASIKHAMTFKTTWSSHGVLLWFIVFMGVSLSPNVKDEPRPSLARLVQQSVEPSMRFFRENLR